MTNRIATAALLAILAGGCATASAPKSQSPLYAEIARMDKVMFDAFNAHDVDKLGTLFDRDLEMYHDTGGVITWQKAMQGFKSNFDKNNGLRRDLVAGSMEVFPIKDYGAIQTGAHRFCHAENGKDDCGVFQFVHVWQKKDGLWKITRAVSYDH